MSGDSAAVPARNRGQVLRAVLVKGGVPIRSRGGHGTCTCPERGAHCCPALPLAGRGGLGPGTRRCGVCTWTNISLGNSIRRNYRGLQLTASRGFPGVQWLRLCFHCRGHVLKLRACRPQKHQAPVPQPPSPDPTAGEKLVCTAKIPMLTKAGCSQK